jgi:hypothetical protein
MSPLFFGLFAKWPGSLTGSLIETLTASPASDKSRFLSFCYALATLLDAIL